MGLSGNEVNRVSNEAFSLVYIQATGASSILLYRAARRISWNVRHSDVILLWENACVVVLPETPVKGAQAVARRISTCLVDLVEAELYALGGSIAQALLRRLHAERAVVVQREIESFSIPRATEQSKQDVLPYLAFLSHYPAPRLLRLVPYDLACRYQCVPVGTEHHMLTLATAQGLDQAAIMHLSDVTRRSIFQVRCPVDIIADILAYWQRLVPPCQSEVSLVSVDVGEML